MKRALFKLGRLFEITTTTEEISYRITIDVAEWVAREDWDFPIVGIDGSSTSFSNGDTGTKIKGIIYVSAKNSATRFKIGIYDNREKSNKYRVFLARNA